jgi:prevent-host-death family protein
MHVSGDGDDDAALGGGVEAVEGDDGGSSAALLGGDELVGAVVGVGGRAPGRRLARISPIMTRILVMSETLPLAEVKSKFSEMVDRVEHTHDRIVVTRNGRPAAVMISPEELASLEDTLELLSDPDAMRELAEAKQAAADGDHITGDELRVRFSRT